MKRVPRRTSLLAALGMFALIAVIAVSWRRAGLEWTSLLGTGVIAVVFAYIAAFPVVEGWLHGLRQEQSTPEQLDQALRALAIAVMTLWSAEAKIRRIASSALITVRWTVRTEQVGVVGSEAAAEVWAADSSQHQQPHLAYFTRQADTLAEAYRQLSPGRLIILGAQGSGKSALAILLTLELMKHVDQRRVKLERCVFGYRIPVLLPIASWDPSEELDRWLQRRLSEDFSQLSNVDAYGATAIESLVASGCLMPILDGLDEIPMPLRSKAVVQLASWRRDSPLIVTCRTEGFPSAALGVHSLGTVVEIDRVKAVDAIAYLRDTTPPARQHLWTPVFAEMTSEPDGTLGKGLSTPLMISLASVIYAEGSVDPLELTDGRRFPHPEAVEDHLLDEFIPTIYTNPPPGARARPWGHKRAQRWLTVLATCVDDHGDLAWWELNRAVPKIVRRFGFSLMAALMIGLIAGLVLAPVMGLGDSLKYVGWHGE